MEDSNLAPSTQGWRAHYIPYIYLLVLAFSLSGNVYLARKIVISNDLKAANASNPEGKIGERVNALEVQTISGLPSAIRFPNRQDTVVYIFSPSCHWCALNLPNIQSLALQRKDALDFIGISVTSDGLREYIESNHLSFPVYLDKSVHDFSLLGFSGTPQTLLIRKDGTVEHNWIGAYVGDTQTSVQRALSVHLPGLSPSSR